MANVTRRGFEWVAAKNGGDKPTPRWIHVATGYATLLAVGDAVKFAADGIQRAAAGDALICGVIVACRYWDGTVLKHSRYVPASTAYSTNLSRQTMVAIIPVVGQLFRVDADDAVTATTLAGYKALINENCDHIVESGSNNNSYMALDISTHAITAAGWRIHDVPDPNLQDFASSRVKLIVECNESEEPAFSTTQTA